MKNTQGFTLTQILIAITIVGILGGIGIPSYMNYITRTQISEGFLFADAARTAVEEDFIMHNKLPKNRSLDGVGKKVDMIDIVSWKLDSQNPNKGSIDVKMNLTHLGQSLTPFLLIAEQNNGAIHWRCVSARSQGYADKDSVDAKYLPAICNQGGSLTSGNKAPSISKTTTKSGTSSAASHTPAATPTQTTALTCKANEKLMFDKNNKRICVKLPSHSAVKCAICAGPPEACELAYYEDFCQPPQNYCINHVTNKADGSKLFERRCGTIDDAHNDWYLGTSDDDKCRKLTGSSFFTYQFECTFACVKDSCNVDLQPAHNTLYTPF